ncbi:hypothetical protein NSQ61_06455 [Aeribacillus sp. FSL K6-1121]|uniref:hypothetical protein n=1 Tax=Aeribacillus sp. FSL K6-1121 TaxID=2954745 RepID=UPI0030F8FC9E
MGWASQAPQQHERLRYQPEHDAAVVALNSSANYLGSAVGSSLGGDCIACRIGSFLPSVCCQLSSFGGFTSTMFDYVQ